VTVAAALVAADLALRQAIADWHGRGTPSPAVVQPAVREQWLELRLAHSQSLERRVLAQLPPRLARDVRDDVTARVELARLTPPHPLSAFRVGPARPALELKRFYAEAQRRSGVPWQVLAAINFVESDFGRLRNESVAGARGPMQFMPSTWAAYGRGNVHDPRQAILAAGRLLRAAGAPRDLRRALYRYNPSRAYADAILRYTRRIVRDADAYLAYYARRLIVRTPRGYRRLN
jgi:membrane-bound lytic murein transglycosylase B